MLFPSRAFATMSTTLRSALARGALLAIAAVLVGTLSSAPPATAAEPSGPTTDPTRSTAIRAGFTIATFNALGHSHTMRGGNKCCSWPGSRMRTHGLVRLVRRNDVDVIGLQEFQPVQQRAFLRRVGRTWNYYGPRDNGIAWRQRRFALVGTGRVVVPYFHGHPKPMPVVTLRDRRSGQRFVVLSVHNPADARGPAQRYRDRAQRRERRFATRVRSAARPLPVFVLGDMNDKRDFFCPFTRTGVMHAASGGGYDGGTCRPPADNGIDWIFGSNGTQFSRFRAVRSPLVARTSDHPFVVAELY